MLAVIHGIDLSHGDYRFIIKNRGPVRFTCLHEVHTCMTHDEPSSMVMTKTPDGIPCIIVHQKSPLLATVPIVKMRVDALDGDRIWWEATVVRVFPNGNVMVHYDLWSEKWDDVISIETGRIAPFRTYTEDWRSSLRKSDKVELRMHVKWVEAVITDEDDMTWTVFSTIWGHQQIGKDSCDIAPYGVHIYPHVYRKKMSVFARSPYGSWSGPTAPLIVKM
jgi:hypothetical protein